MSEYWSATSGTALVFPKEERQALEVCQQHRKAAS